MSDTFLAVFTGSKTSPKMQAWFELPQDERRAKEMEGFLAWKAWAQTLQNMIKVAGSDGLDPGVAA